ncbi:MAG: hypothetical protein RLZZ323_874 [Bacteroidota bacterium]|jgi:hypothetical protein
MERREALKRVAYLMGGAISATTMGVLFESFTVLDKSKMVNFSVSDEAILAEFAEIIIPTTAASPGAKAAGLGPFIPMMIRDCYPANLQELFAQGLKDMDEKCIKTYGKNFVALSDSERLQVMTNLRDEAKSNSKQPSFFAIARDLTILGYYSSEIGCTQAREYIAIPGRYDGSAPLEPGQKAWATS